MKSSFYQYSNSGLINQFSGDTYTGLLPANTEKTLTVPYIKVSGGGQTGGNPSVIAVITSSGVSPVFVANNEAAAVPTGDFSAAAGEIVNAGSPLIKNVNSGDILSFKTPAGAANILVSVAFYLAI